jgi:ABC-2 type transport system permease protein
MLPPFWQTATLFNPVVYLVSGFRWAFFDTADVAVTYSLMAIALFSLLFVAVISVIFKTGYRLKP